MGKDNRAAKHEKSNGPSIKEVVKLKKHLTINKLHLFFLTTGLTFLGIEDNVIRCELKERCAGFEALPPGSAEALGPALIDVRARLKSFNISARKLINHGAEVMIPGCSLISLAARFAPGMEYEYPNGLTDVDGLAVADLIGDAIKHLGCFSLFEKGGFNVD